MNVSGKYCNQVGRFTKLEKLGLLKKSLMTYLSNDSRKVIQIACVTCLVLWCDFAICIIRNMQISLEAHHAHCDHFCGPLRSPILVLRRCPSGTVLWTDV